MVAMMFLMVGYHYEEISGCVSFLLGDNYLGVSSPRNLRTQEGFSKNRAAA